MRKGVSKGTLPLAFYALTEQNDDKLCAKHDGDQCDGVGCGVSGAYVLGTRNVNERTQCRGRGHTAGNRAQVVE